MYAEVSKKEYPSFYHIGLFFTLAAGVLLFSIGLYNADNLQLNEKGYYIAVMLLCIVGAILTQKVARDNAEDNEIIAEQERKYNQSKDV